MEGRTKFVDVFFGPNKDEEYPKHQKTSRAKWLQAIEEHLQANDAAQTGPFVIGNTITYADLVLYQICHDENLTQEGRKGLKDHPRLVKLVDAVESRPNIAAFLKSDRYKG